MRAGSGSAARIGLFADLIVGQIPAFRPASARYRHDPDST
ncbi:hypothetical protein BSLA_02f2284 [Burkholderia stabilis]|nr:hypothetical protein BSLA_02f2284 [Burkholderia stabilis]